MQNLIIEADEIKTLKGREFEKFGAEFNCCELNAKLAAKSGRREGNYITVQTYGDTQICKSLVYALREFVKRGKRVLVAGMGNGDVVADALGRRVVEYLKKHELKGSRISVFAPDVGALTNLDSVKLVQSVSYGFSPDYVVAVDAPGVQRQGDEPAEGGAPGDVAHLGAGAADGPGHVVALPVGPAGPDVAGVSGLPAGAAEDGPVADKYFRFTPWEGFDARGAEDIFPANACAPRGSHDSASPS